MHDYHSDYYSPVWRNDTSGHERPVNFDYGIQLVQLNRRNLICMHVTVTQLEAAGYTKDHIAEIYARVPL